ncbi:MAG TPA: hypothetical protein VE093_31445 [Polyangiaceae bacterium]|nr:hypothetical protein [Polyangiaceae bacterium]
MGSLHSPEQGYAVPTYRAPADACWYHFLHGNVPGHQIDFIYRPEVPQGALLQQHFSHLARIIKYIEPRPGAPCAFAIGNLSRDDTQHEPGHGGVALILGHRMKGATDHAGRRDPPFAHGIAAVNRNLDSEALFASAMAFCRHVIEEPSADDPRALAPMYARFTAASLSERAAVVEAYLEGFADLPRIERSRLSRRWLSRGGPPAKRIVIGYAEDAPFWAIARAATRIAAMLYQSDIRWTSITTGREPDILNGVAIRFVPRREAVTSEPDTLVLQLEQVPEDEPGIAARLFGAVDTNQLCSTIPPAGWRSFARAVTAEIAGAQAEPREAPAEVGSVRAADENGSPIKDRAQDRSDDGVTDAVTLVRMPMVRAQQEPGSTAERGEPAQERASSADIVVTWDEPASANAAQGASDEGKEQRLPGGEAWSMGGGGASSESRGGAAELGALLSDSGRMTRKDLPADIRPRRRWLWMGVGLGGVASILAALFFVGRIAASEPEPPVLLEAPSAEPGAELSGSSSTPRHAAVGEVKPAPGEVKEEAVAGEVPETQMSPRPPTDSAGGVVGGVQGGPGGAGSFQKRTIPKSSGAQPIRPSRRAYGGGEAIW